MAETVLEIHVPLVAADAPDGEDPYAWIDDVEDFLAECEEDGRLEVLDDGEEIGADYVFFITGAPEDELLAVALEVARLPFVPEGAFAVVAEEDQAEIGAGRRVDLAVG